MSAETTRAPSAITCRAARAAVENAYEGGALSVRDELR
jgi:hypothetical protein